LADELRAWHCAAARCFYRAVVRLDEIPHDGQSETEAAVPAGRGAVRLAERFEDARQQIWRNALARVRDDELRAAARAAQLDVHGAAFGRELQRVGDQVRRDLLQARWIAVDAPEPRVGGDRETAAL